MHFFDDLVDRGSSFVELENGGATVVELIPQLSLWDDQSAF
jgi:hypothetical protein